MRYHYRDTKKNTSVYILSSQLANESFARTLWGVSPTEYPDPPNMSILVKAVNSAGPGRQKESSTVETRVKKDTGPKQASPADPAPVVKEGQPEPTPVPSKAEKNTSPRTSVIEV